MVGGRNSQTLTKMDYPAVKSPPPTLSKSLPHQYSAADTFIFNLHVVIAQTHLGGKKKL